MYISNKNNASNSSFLKLYMLNRISSDIAIDMCFDEIC